MRIAAATMAPELTPATALDRNVVFLERAQNADVRDAAREPSTERQPNAPEVCGSFRLRIQLRRLATNSASDSVFDGPIALPPLRHVLCLMYVAPYIYRCISAARLTHSCCTIAIL